MSATTALATLPGTLAARADPRPVAAYLASLGSDVSRLTMHSHLRRAARLIGAADSEDVSWWTMTPAHMRALASKLADGFSPATANVTLAALRGVLRAAWDLSLIDRDTLERLTRDHGGKAHKVRGTSPPTGRHLEPGELVALFRAAGSDRLGARGARDAALLAVLDGGGLRRAEAVALDVGDVEIDAETVTVRRGKGRKARAVPLASGATSALSAWLVVRGDDPGPLFLVVNKGGRVIDGRLPERGVQRILDRLASAAGVAPFTAHDFRRTVAGDLLERGADIVTVQHILGHASPVTTARYDRRPAEARCKAARLRAVPYREHS